MVKSFTKIDVSTVPDSVKKATNVLQDAGYEVFCIGGCVRDLILNKGVRDWDLTTNAKPEDIEALFDHTFYENPFGTVTVIFDDETVDMAKQIEITPYRKEGVYSDSRRPDAVCFDASLEEDCSRRDFTFNAIALHALTGEVFDFYGGVQDLLKGILKTIGKPDDRFNEDALRLMRGVRLAGDLNFTIEEDTLRAMKAMASLLKNIAVERVRDEFFRMIDSKNTVYSFTLLYTTGLMDVLLPEFSKGWQVEQNKAHTYDVFTHNLKTLEHSVEKGLPFYIKLSAFFHDIAKPHTREWSEKRNTWSFHNHEVVGARIARNILKEFKVPHNLSKKVVTMVRWHMFFSDTTKISESAVRRLLVRVGEEMLFDLIDLRMCDRIGTGRPKENPYRLRQYTAMVEKVLRNSITPKNLALNGNDLIEELDMSPSKQIGWVLTILLFEFLDTPENNTRDKLLARSKKLLTLSPEVLETMSKDAKKGIAVVEREEEEQIDKKYGVS